jgi:dual-specificity kinase
VGGPLNCSSVTHHHSPQQTPSFLPSFIFSVISSSSTAASTANALVATMQSVVHPLVAPMHSHRSHYPHPTLESALTRTTASGLTMPTPPISRKRKRPHQLSVSYSEVQEIDADGRLREVIIIEDTPPPPATISPAVSTSTQHYTYSSSHQPPLFNAPIRTRARAAAEAQVMSASTSSAITLPPATKKRKRELELDGGVAAVATKKPQTNGKYAQQIAPTKSWASGSAATEDVRRLASSLWVMRC